MANQPVEHYAAGAARFTGNVYEVTKPFAGGMKGARHISCL